ncbi:MAG: helix-turn-helix transcriptional regulator [Isosphaerales bacterium]
MCANERPRLRTEAALDHVGFRTSSNSTTPARPGSSPIEAAVGNGDSPIESLLAMGDLCRILKVSRSKLERLRAARRIPPPDVDLRTVSKPIPRWRPETIRRWIERGGTP